MQAYKYHGNPATETGHLGFSFFSVEVDGRGLLVASTHNILFWLECPKSSCDFSFVRFSDFLHVHNIV